MVVCKSCGKTIETTEGYFTLESGENYCEDCYKKVVLRVV
jgi:NMD protein affecting ribosome stability and mRNA decay